MNEEIPTADELLTEIRNYASMLFVDGNSKLEGMLRPRKGDGEDVKLIRTSLGDFFDIGVAYGVSATVEVLQRLEVIPRIHPDTEIEKENGE